MQFIVMKIVVLFVALVTPAALMFLGFMSAWEYGFTGFCCWVVLTSVFLLLVNIDQKLGDALGNKEEAQ